MRVLLLLILALARPPAADLEGRLEPLVPLLRRAAPFTVDLVLRWRGKGLLRCRPHIVLRDGAEVALRWEGPELLLGPDELRRRLHLPLAEGHQLRNLGGELHLVASDREAIWDLGESKLGSGGVSRHVAAFIDAGRQGLLDREATLALLPDLGTALAGPAAVAVERVGTLARDWDGCDLVVVDHFTLALLDRAQRRGLRRWAERGGTVALVAPEAEHAAACATFLGGAPTTGPGSLPLGLGQLLLLDPDEMRDAAAQRRFWQYIWPAAYRGTDDAATNRLLDGFHRLLDHGARGPSRTVLIGLLLVFLALIGPLDGLVVRLTRRHLLTWITFPLYALLSAGAIMVLAHQLIGGGDHRRRLVVWDLAADGTVLRSWCIERHFLGAGRDLRLVAGTGSVGLLPRHAATMGTAFTNAARQVAFQDPARWLLGDAGLERVTALPKWTGGLVLYRDAEPPEPLLAALSGPQAAEQEGVVIACSLAEADRVVRTLGGPVDVWRWLLQDPGGAPRGGEALDDLGWSWKRHGPAGQARITVLRRGADWLVVRRLPAASEELP